MTKAPAKRKSKKDTLGDPPNPVPIPPVLPPGGCDLSDICDSVRSIITAIRDAPTGSIIQAENGGVRVTPPPNPLTAELIMVLNPATGFWEFGTR